MSECSSILYGGIGSAYICNVFCSQLSKKDHGEYKATLKDDRGQDVSVLEVAGKGKMVPSLSYNKIYSVHERGPVEEGS